MKIIKQLLSNSLLLMVLFAALALPIASMTLLKYRAAGNGGVLSATSRLVEYRDDTTEFQNTYQEENPIPQPSTQESTQSQTDSIYQW